MLSTCERINEENPSVKHVKFAKCYLAVCIPTGEKRLKFIGPEHYKKAKVVDYDALPEKKRELALYKAKREYEKRNTAHGMFGWLANMCIENINYNPETFLRVCNNVVNDVENIVKDKVFNINWNLYYKHRPLITELKTNMSIICEQFNDFVKNYYEKARAFQKPFKDNALYLTRDQIDRFRRMHNIHVKQFVRILSAIIDIMRKTKSGNVYDKIKELENNAIDALNEMQKYEFTPKDTIDINERVNNDKVYQIVNTCYNTFRDNIPINKVHHLVKFHIVGDYRECIAFEILEGMKEWYDYKNDDGKLETLANVLKSFREYKRHTTSPLLPRINPFSKSNTASCNYTI